jgi:hypothetical protein
VSSRTGGLVGPTAWDVVSMAASLFRILVGFSFRILVGFSACSARRAALRRLLHRPGAPSV